MCPEAWEGRTRPRGKHCEALSSRLWSRGSWSSARPSTRRTGSTGSPTLGKGWGALMAMGWGSPEMLRNHPRFLRRDWCVSRQLWWGHQIPAYLVVQEPVEVGWGVEGTLGKVGRVGAESQGFPLWPGGLLEPVFLQLASRGRCPPSDPRSTLNHTGMPRSSLSSAG